MKKYEYDLNIPFTILSLKKLSFLERGVLAIIHHLDDNGCTATNQFIADRLSLSLDQVRRAVFRLIENGYVFSKCVKGGSKRGTERVLSCRLIVSQNPESADLHHRSSPESADLHGGVVQNCTVEKVPDNGLPEKQTADKRSDSLITDNNNNIYIGILGKEKTLKVSTYEEEENPFGIKIAAPAEPEKKKSPLEIGLRERAIKLGKSFRWTDSQWEQLKKMTDESLFLCMELCKGFNGDLINFNYFYKIVETHGIEKKLVASRVLPKFTPTLMTL